MTYRDEQEVDTRMLVKSGEDEGEPILKPWISLVNDNPPDPQGRE